jgi:hypothetical protein
MTFVLGERPDRSLYFISGVKRFSAEPAVRLGGDYRLLDFAESGAKKSVPFALLHPYGVDMGGRLLLRSQAPRDDGQVATTLLLLNPDSGLVEVSRTLECPLLGLRILDDRVILKYADSYEVCDLSMRTIQGRIPLPSVVLSAVKQHSPRGRTDYRADHMPDAVAQAVMQNVTTVYDISSDLMGFVYCGESGLEMYESRNGTVSLLAQSPGGCYVFNPHFVDGEKKIAAMLSRGEGRYSYLLYDTSTREPQYLDNNTYANLDFASAYQEGMADLAYPDNRLRTGQGDIKGDLIVNYLDYATGKLTARTIAMTDLATQENATNPRASVFSDRYFAYTTSRNSTTGDGADATCNIVLVDLATMQARTVLTSKAGQLMLCSVTNDGRAVFAYMFEDEYGWGITENHK